LCLALGFRGRFALVGGRELDPWLDRLAQPLAVEPTPLAIPGRGQADVDETALARRRPFWLVPAIVLAVALVAHLGLGFALSSDVDALASKGRALRSQQGGAP
jgi:type VI protein secretion system component VasF